MKHTQTVLKLQGGLGNQMFQYATGLAVSKHNNSNLILDISNYKNQSSKDTVRFFELSNFNISVSSFTNTPTKKTKEIFNKIKNKLFPLNPYAFDSKIFSLTILDSFFQNEAYFINIKEQLLKEFTLKTESAKFIETRKYIQSIPNASIHIRRSDYVSNPHARTYHGVQSIEYYKKAYIELTQKIGTSFTLLIFTDDLEWVQKNITFHSQNHILSNQGFSAPEELLLMSYCQHNIIANSTFSWWAAWLNQNPNKIIIAPKRWTAKDTENEIIPKTWKKI